MVVRHDDSGDDGLIDNTSWWSSDDHPLAHLLEFIAAGSRLLYEYRPTARIGGSLGVLEIAPVVGVARYAQHHEYITGMHFICGDRKCLLDFDEFVGLLKLMEAWIGPHACITKDPDRPVVKSAHYETRNGLVIEATDVLRVSVASPVTIILTGSQLEQLLRECQRIKVFLDEFR